MNGIKLKFGNLAVVKQDNLWIVYEGYNPDDGTYKYKRETKNINEASIVFSDIFSLRVRDWAQRMLEKEALENASQAQSGQAHT